MNNDLPEISPAPPPARLNPRSAETSESEFPPRPPEQAGQAAEFTRATARSKNIVECFFCDRTMHNKLRSRHIQDSHEIQSAQSRICQCNFAWIDHNYKTSLDHELDCPVTSKKGSWIWDSEHKLFVRRGIASLKYMRWIERARKSQAGLNPEQAQESLNAQNPWRQHSTVQLQQPLATAHAPVAPAFNADRRADHNVRPWSLGHQTIYMPDYRESTAPSVWQHSLGMGPEQFSSSPGFGWQGPLSSTVDHPSNAIVAQQLPSDPSVSTALLPPHHYPLISHIDPQWYPPPADGQNQFSFHSMAHVRRFLCRQARIYHPILG